MPHLTVLDGAGGEELVKLVEGPPVGPAGDPLVKLDRALRRLSESCGERLTIDKARALIFVAINPLMTATDIAAGLGQAVTTTSRQLIDLGPRSVGEAGPLVEVVPDAIDMRIKRHRLTKQGETLARKLRRTLE